VRTQGVEGAWSDYAEVHVVIGELTPTPPTIRSTLTPTSSATPATTPTPTPSSGLFGAPQLSAGGFYYGFAGCRPTQVTARVAVAQPSAVKVVVFFYRLKDKASGATTNRSEGQAISPQGGGSYGLTLRGDSIELSGNYNEAHGIYQFVAQMNDGTMPRSPAHSHLVLGRCGLIVLPPIIIMPSTPTIEIIK